jgi:hypothetical protein
VKPALQELLRTLPKRLPAVAPEVSALQGLVKRLDNSLEGCAAAGEMWQLYRRILGFYSHHGRFQPVAPPAPAAGTGFGALLMLSGAGGSSPQPAAAYAGECAVVCSEAIPGVAQQGYGVDGEGCAEGSLADSAAPTALGAMGVECVDELSTTAASRISSGAIASCKSGEARPLSPATRLQGAAAVLGRPGSPLQPVTANRGASGNLSGSSTNRSLTASPPPT